MSDLISNFSVIGGAKTLVTLKRYEDYSVAETDLECDICGANHTTKNCTFLPEEQTISDSKALSHARLTLPPNLKVETLGDGTTAVKTLADFKKGTRFGPLEAKKTRALNPFTMFPLKVFGRTERQTFYLDTSSEDICNWMCLVPGSTERLDNPASLNLMCYQMNGAIFYTTTRQIKEGEWLRVGYAPNYAVRMGLKPLIIFQDKNEEQEAKKMKMEAEERMRQQIVSQLSAKDLGVPKDRIVSRWTCQLCKQDFTKVDVYAAHLREHYKPAPKLTSVKRRKKKCDRTCDTCSTEFKTRQLLLKHVCAVRQGNISQLRNSDDLATMEGMTMEDGNTGLVVPNETLERLLQQYEASVDMENMFGSEEAAPHGSSTPKRMDASLSEASFDSSHFLSVPRRPADKMPDHPGFLEMNPNDSFNPEQFLNDELLLDKFKIPEGKILDMEGGSLDMSNISMFSLDQNQLLSNEEYLNAPVDKQHADAEENCSRASATNLFDLEQSFQKQVTRILTNIDNELTKMSHDGSGQTKGDTNEDHLTDSSTVYTMSDSFLRSIELKPPDRFAKSPDLSFMNEDNLVSTVETQYTQTERDKSGLKCAICSKSFANKSNLARHMRKHTGDFVCTACFGVFARKETLYSHKCPLNPNMLSVQCDTCGKKFTRKAFLERHIASKHLGLWKCELCKNAYSSEHYLSSHECSARGGADRNQASFKCSFCAKCFTRRAYLSQHLKRHPTRQCRHCGKTLVNVERHESYCGQATDLDPDGLAKCPDCEQVIIDLVTFRKHALKHTHPWVCGVCGLMFGAAGLLEEHRCSEIKCDVCPESFSTFSAFQAHSASHGVPDHHCFECGISYHTLDGISSHECTGLREIRKKFRNHRLARANVSRLIEGERSTTLPPPGPEDSRQYVCDQCGRVFQLKSSLAFHIQQHNGEKYQCHICDMVFDRKDILKNHYTVHQEPQVACPQCGRRFKTTKSRDVHMRVHTGSGFPCHRCDQSFTQKMHLVKHMAVHDPRLKQLQQRQCTVCLAWLNNRYCLAQHMLAHTQGRTEPCPVTACGKAFLTPALLKAHIRSIHLHGGFVCPYCDKTIRFKASMKRHLLMIHRDMKEEFQAAGFFDTIKSPPVEAEIQDLLRNTVSVEEGPVQAEVVPDNATADNADNAPITFPPLNGAEESVQPVTSPHVGEDGNLPVLEETDAMEREGSVDVGAQSRVSVEDVGREVSASVTVKYVDENGQQVDVLVAQLTNGGYPDLAVASEDPAETYEENERSVEAGGVVLVTQLTNGGYPDLALPSEDPTETYEENGRSVEEAGGVDDDDAEMGDEVVDGATGEEITDCEVPDGNEAPVNTDDNANELVWIEDGMILQLSNDNQISFIVVGAENENETENTDGSVT